MHAKSISRLKTTLRWLKAATAVLSVILVISGIWAMGWLSLPGLPSPKQQGRQEVSDAVAAALKSCGLSELKIDQPSDVAQWKKSIDELVTMKETARTNEERQLAYAAAGGGQKNSKLEAISMYWPTTAEKAASQGENNKGFLGLMARVKQQREEELLDPLNWKTELDDGAKIDDLAVLLTSAGKVVAAVSAWKKGTTGAEASDKETLDLVKFIENQRDSVKAYAAMERDPVMQAIKGLATADSPTGTVFVQRLQAWLAGWDASKSALNPSVENKSLWYARAGGPGSPVDGWLADSQETTKVRQAFAAGAVSRWKIETQAKNPRVWIYKYVDVPRKLEPQPAYPATTIAPIPEGWIDGGSGEFQKNMPLPSWNTAKDVNKTAVNSLNKGELFLYIE